MKSIQDKHQGEHRYLTHNNGGRPFLVYVGKDTVTVYAAPNRLDRDSCSYEEFKNSYTKLVKRFTGVEKKFIPKYPSIRMRGGHTFERTGNALLLKVKTGYVFIGHEIYSFKTKEEIKKFYSPVGNNDVPYPLAIGKENVYFLLEKRCVPKKDFPKGIDWENDAYGFFYDALDGVSMNGVKSIVGGREH